MQSTRPCSWISTTATAAAHRCGTVITTAAPIPIPTNDHVRRFGVTRVLTSRRVRWIEACLIYHRPAQCSPLVRPTTVGGWATRRISSTLGRVIGAPSVHQCRDSDNDWSEPAPLRYATRSCVVVVVEIEVEDLLDRPLDRRLLAAQV